MSSFNTVAWSRSIYFLWQNVKFRYNAKFSTYLKAYQMSWSGVLHNHLLFKILLLLAYFAVTWDLLNRFTIQLFPMLFAGQQLGLIISQLPRHQYSNNHWYVIQTGKVTLSDKGREGLPWHEGATCPSNFVIPEVAASLYTSRMWRPWYLIMAVWFGTKVINLTKVTFSDKITDAGALYMDEHSKGGSLGFIGHYQNMCWIGCGTKSNLIMFVGRTWFWCWFWKV